MASKQEWLFTFLIWILILSTKKSRTQHKFKSIQSRNKPITLLIKILENGNIISWLKILKFTQVQGIQRFVIQTIWKVLLIHYNLDKDVNLKTVQEVKLSTLATFQNLDLDTLLEYNWINNKTVAEMEHYGENITGHVIMVKQFSIDLIKLKLGTSQKSNNPIKFDILYSIY